VPTAREIPTQVKVCGVFYTDLHVTEGELPDAGYPIIPDYRIVGRACAAEEFLPLPHKYRSKLLHSVSRSKMLIVHYK